MERFILRVALFLLVFNINIRYTSAQAIDSIALITEHAYSLAEADTMDPLKVYKLDLHKSKLTSLPPGIFKFRNLIELDLSKNRFTSFPDSLYRFSNLQVLDLSRNNLTSVPPSISRLKSLRTLILNQNEIEELPEEMGELENLQTLDLWSNNIEEIPSSFTKLKNLKALDMRVILLSDDKQEEIKALLPNTRIYFSPGCNCGN